MTNKRIMKKISEIDRIMIYIVSEKGETGNLHSDLPRLF